MTNPNQRNQEKPRSYRGAKTLASLAVGAAAFYAMEMLGGAENASQAQNIINAAPKDAFLYTVEGIVSVAYAIGTYAALDSRLAYRMAKDIKNSVLRKDNGFN